MGNFNPDKYLSEFDPDSYLAEPDQGTASDAIMEPAKAIIGGALTEAAAGIGGIAQAINPFADERAGVQAVEDIRAAAPDFSPQTETGKKSLETIGSLIDYGIDIINYPLSGLEGLSHLVRGQGVEKAAQTIRDIQENGLGQNLGSRMLEETGSPLIATAARMTPDIVGTVLGGGAASRTAREGGRAASAVGKELQAAVDPTIKTGRELVQGATSYQAPATRDMVRQIEAGSNDPALAKYEVAQTGKPQVEGEPPQTGVERFFDTKGPKVKADPQARYAISQGAREGVVQPMKNASKPDKDLMLKMTNIADRAKKDELYGMENRPGDVAGDLLMDRLDVIRRANKRAGMALKPITDNMKGKSVDVSEVGANLSDALDDMGVTLARGDDGKLVANYEGSNIEGATTLTGWLDNVLRRVDRVAGSGKIDAFELHQLKKFIDDQVTFGKSSDGLSGQTERVLKRFRTDINDTLGNNFNDYAKANETYSGTIKALDAFQDVAGRKMDLLGDNADKATGTLMRRLMSNAQSRITLLDSLKGIDDAVDKFSAYGGPLRIKGKGGAKNDLKMLVLYADELDRLLGSAPRTSLQGQFDQSFGTAARAATSKSGLFEASVDLTGKAASKAYGVIRPSAVKSDENTIKALRELLKKQSAK